MIQPKTALYLWWLTSPKKLSLAPESGSVEVFGKAVSDLQTSIAISDEGAITGTLKYVTGYTGYSQSPELQSGNFLALTLADNDFSEYTSVKVGLDPSEGSGLVEIRNDPDHNVVARIADATTQKFVIVASNYFGSVTQEYDLSDLTINES